MTTTDASADDSGIRWGTDIDPTPHREQCVLDAGSVEHFLNDYRCREIDPEPVRQPAGIVVTATPSPNRAKPGDRVAVSLVVENRQDKPVLLVFDYDIGSPNDIFGSAPHAPRDPITIEAVRDPGGASSVEYVTESRGGLAALGADASAPPRQVQHLTLAPRTRAVTDLTWTVPSDAKGRWLLRVHTRILWSWTDRKSLVALARVDVSG